MKSPSHPVAENPLPAWHFVSPTGEECHPFDPNGAIFHGGRHHLGYIYQDQGKHFWGHASTTDFIHWKQHPPMLSPGPEEGIFSGNAFLDKDGRVVLAYHGIGTKDGRFPKGNCLAVAGEDNLDPFKKWDANPVISGGWDPHAWYEDGTYYQVSGGRPPMLHTTTDETLSKWELAGPLLSHDLPDVAAIEDISCPDLFKLGDKHVLLCISHTRGVRYYLGRFENKQFIPESHHRMNGPGGCFFAPETYPDDRGRRILWGWALGEPSTLSIPRVLTLGADGVMGIQPIPELEALRKSRRTVPPCGIPPWETVPAPGIGGACMELHVTLDPKGSAACGVKVRRSPGGEEETTILYDAPKKVLRIEMAKSSLDASRLPRYYCMTFQFGKDFANPAVNDQEAPFELKPGEHLDLRIFLDHSILEVFANGRQCLTQRLYPTRADSTGVALLARETPAELVALEAWEMGAMSIQ